MTQDQQSPSPADSGALEVLPPAYGTPPRKLPGGALLASAARISIGDRADFGKREQWQDEAWDMYDSVGELHFLVRTLADMVGRGRLSVLETLPDGTVETEDVLTAELIGLFGGPMAVQQTISDLVVGLIVVGEAFWTIDMAAEAPVFQVRSRQDLKVTGEKAKGNLKVFEVRPGKSDKLLPPTTEVYRVWRPHPKNVKEVDCPTKAALPVLRELVGLTMYISAQIDSRLAGAGVFIAPDSAAMLQRVDPENQDLTVDVPIGDVMVDAMVTPIRDRDSAASIVPLVLTVPKDDAPAFRHIPFAGGLDKYALALRDEAIRRLAMAMDCPPELLLGTGGLNHWSAWLMREDVISTHVEPYAAAISSAFTTEWMAPLLEGKGLDPAPFTVDLSMEDLVLRPNRSAEAQALYDRGVLSTDALLEANGFAPEDAPPVQDTRERALGLVLGMVAKAPSLLTTIEGGLPALVDQVESALTGSGGSVAPLGAGSTASGAPGSVSSGAAPD